MSSSGPDGWERSPRYDRGRDERDDGARGSDWRESDWREDLERENDWRGSRGRDASGRGNDWEGRPGDREAGWDRDRDPGSWRRDRRESRPAYEGGWPADGSGQGRRDHYPAGGGMGETYPDPGGVGDRYPPAGEAGPDGGWPARGGSGPPDDAAGRLPSDQAWRADQERRGTGRRPPGTLRASSRDDERYRHESSMPGPFPAEQARGQRPYPGDPAPPGPHRADQAGSQAYPDERPMPRFYPRERPAPEPYPANPPGPRPYAGERAEPDPYPANPRQADPRVADQYPAHRGPSWDHPGDRPVPEPYPMDRPTSYPVDPHRPQSYPDDRPVTGPYPDAMPPPQAYTGGRPDQPYAPERQAPNPYPGEPAVADSYLDDRPRSQPYADGPPPPDYYAPSGAAPPAYPDERPTPRFYPADRTEFLYPDLPPDGYGLPAEAELTEAEFASALFRPAAPDAARDQPGPSLVRSSSVMAIGTIVSRGTGFVRTAVLVYALGIAWLGTAYNYANTLPNTVYNLAIGGILTSVIVPLLVNSAKRDRDRGEQYTQRMFTLVTIALAIVTIAATLASWPIADLYGCGGHSCSEAHPLTANYHYLLVLFAYFFIPQIFFYGISSLAGAILNARGHFAAPMWTPVVNNIVVIVVTVMFLAIAGVGQNVQNGYITSTEIWLLGIGTTLGIVAQTVALIPALRRVGFRWHPRFDFKRYEIGEIGRMAGWMFGYVVTTQVAYLVTARIAGTIPKAVVHAGHDFAAYQNAWLLFQLPYAIVGISVITALLPRMSAHASERRYDLVRSDFSTGLRLGSVIVAPAALILAVIGPPLAEVLFSFGNTSEASARFLGVVFSVFSIGLMPYMLFQLLLRVFYSLHDSRTPALIGVVTMIANVATNLLAWKIASPSDLVAGLGIAFGVSNAVGCVLAWRVLSRRLGGLAGREIGASLSRMHIAVIPGVLFAIVVTLGIGTILSTGRLGSAVTVVVAGGGATLLYVAVARAMRVREVTELTDMVRSRLRR